MEAPFNGDARRPRKYKGKFFTVVSWKSDIGCFWAGFLNSRFRFWSTQMSLVAILTLNDCRESISSKTHAFVYLHMEVVLSLKPNSSVA